MEHFLQEQTPKRLLQNYYLTNHIIAQRLVVIQGCKNTATFMFIVFYFFFFPSNIPNLPFADYKHNIQVFGKSFENI